MNISRHTPPVFRQKTYRGASSLHNWAQIRIPLLPPHASWHRTSYRGFPWSPSHTEITDLSQSPDLDAAHELIIGGVSLAGGGADLHNLLPHVLVHVRITNHRVTSRANKFISCLTLLVFTCIILALQFSLRPCFVSKVVNFTLFTTKC